MSDTLFPNPNGSFPPTNDAGSYFFPRLSFLSYEASSAEEFIALCKKSYDELLKALEKLKITLAGEIVYTYSPSIIRFKVPTATPKDAYTLLKSESELGIFLNRRGVRIYICEERDKTIIVEAPHICPDILYLRELLESDAFVNASGKLNVAIGRNATGSNEVLDITKTPHILIGGTTGSGKTVLLNNILLSLLYTKTPNDVKFILIDPKNFEFFSYNDIPHLLTPVITSPQKAISALRATVETMKNRFKLFEETGVRSIDAYNQKFSDEKLPYIVVVVDELADLMLTNSEQVEMFIAMLAQKARATGIHLIIATQCLKENVLTDILTINIPTRIAMAATCEEDSQVILGSSDAKKLNLFGDMLLLKNGDFNAKRVQSCFVSYSNADKVCDRIRTYNAPVVYDKVFMALMDE